MLRFLEVRLIRLLILLTDSLTVQPGAQPSSEGFSTVPGIPDWKEPNLTVHHSSETNSAVYNPLLEGLSTSTVPGTPEWNPDVFASITHCSTKAKGEDKINGYQVNVAIDLFPNMLKFTDTIYKPGILNTDQAEKALRICRSI